MLRLVRKWSSPEELVVVTQRHLTACPLLLLPTYAQVLSPCTPNRVTKPSTFMTPPSRGSTRHFFSQNFCQNSEYFWEFLPNFCVKFYPKKRVITTFPTKKARKCDIRDKKKRVIAALTDSRQKKRVNHFQARPCPIKIKHKSSFFNPAPKERPLDFNKDSNNHICWRQMLYKGLVIIITASFSDCKTFGKSLRISVKFCHWNPKNSEILSKLRNSE